MLLMVDGGGIIHHIKRSRGLVLNEFIPEHYPSSSISPLLPLCAQNVVDKNVVHGRPTQLIDSYTE